MLPKIPIDDLYLDPPPKPPPPGTRYGHVFAFESAIPVKVVVELNGHLTISQSAGQPSLGEWFEAISQQLSKKQVESLLKKETVTL